MPDKRTVLVIGAGGGVATVMVKRLKSVMAEGVFTLADIHPDRIAPEIKGSQTTTLRLDIFDAAGLSAAVREHDVVLNCAGPFCRTAEPVAATCVRHRKPYLDLSDDAEAVEALLRLHDDARAAGVALLIGAGVSPGFTNVFAADLKTHFKEIDVMDVGWLSGDEGGRAQGRAVLEHVLHIAGGKGARWRDGVLEEFDSYTIPSKFPMGGSLGDRALYEMAHPEPMMLGRTFRGIPLIRCFGGIDPPAVGAVVKGVAHAAHKNQISVDEAVEFMQAASSGRIAAPRAWLPALRGVVDGLASKRISVGDAIRFGGYLLGGHQTFAGGVISRIHGISGWRRRTLIMRSASSGPGTFVDSMPNATGTCAAAFAQLLIAGDLPPGIRFPEELSPTRVFDALARLGFKKEEMIDPVFESDAQVQGISDNMR